MITILCYSKKNNLLNNVRKSEELNTLNSNNYIFSFNS